MLSFRPLLGERSLGKVFPMSSKGQGLAAAPQYAGAQVMVEGETLLVLFLHAPCQRSALQGSSSNGRGPNITCPPFLCALPAFGVIVAARLAERRKWIFQSTIAEASRASASLHNCMPELQSVPDELN